MLALLFTLASASLSGVAALPQSAPATPFPNNTLPSYYTLTVFSSPNTTLNGLKVEYGAGFSVFRSNTSSYCPLTPPSQCPQGNELAFAGVLGPLSEVPGGQDSYISTNGLLVITVQHSHSIPTGAFWAYDGMSWTPFPNTTSAQTAGYNASNSAPTVPGCPKDNPFYDCRVPSGIFTWNHNGTTGLFACDNPYVANTTSIFAKTSSFNQTGCKEITGLGTQEYKGPVPAVWSY